MKSRARILFVVAMMLAAGAVRAGEQGAPTGRGYSFGLAITLGEGMYFIDDNVYRGPVSLEVVPSLGWTWFKFDLGVSTTLESIRIAGTHVGDWSMIFRPGGRLTPPVLPLYLRIAFPLQVQRHNFDWGVMFGLGADIHLAGILGLVLEVDTALNDDLSWGGDGVPLEFRAGVSLHF